MPMFCQARNAIYFAVLHCHFINQAAKQILGVATQQPVYTFPCSHPQREFMDDMTRLGVRMPTVLTRVSEYIPEVRV